MLDGREGCISSHNAAAGSLDAFHLGVDLAFGGLGHFWHDRDRRFRSVD